MTAHLLGLVDAHGRNISCSSNKGIGNRTGQIVKLHKSCSHGVAEIRPSNGSSKVSRRLQAVSAI